ncbi:hypothetical protein LCGC14_2134360 [marine sediment metagenome]|uniref:Uncharacterized protein n=1 Tax=marine sediment metagenome TaxID=412755 RepID=A0A0F9E0I2_9ZZZZ
MVIPWKEIDIKKLGGHDQKVWDRFGREYHILVYFDWKPEVKQGSLL